ncbi:hypothetical protein ACH6EH_19835 [Paenibacillus sp. JSM ZJ436]|uniref:Uncharacterized protein n=1 Tax=Paenibacillus algicola TaxID=2565926 RepID=A0A4P8XHL5_9BACL|nr:hypothetical protein [Paenibacillus algicola]QCT01683.1 hypothetical protein E6C60_0965 [Paenibacillus algicola]
MNEVQLVINNIKNNNVAKDELVHFLDSHNILIKANAIFQIVKLKIDDDIVIQKLAKLAQNAEEEPKVIGLYNNSHFALAALSWLETENSLEKFEGIVNGLQPDKYSTLQNLIEERPYLYL